MITTEFDGWAAPVPPDELVSLDHSQPQPFDFATLWDQANPHRDGDAGCECMACCDQRIAEENWARMTPAQRLAEEVRGLVGLEQPREAWVRFDPAGRISETAEQQLFQHLAGKVVRAGGGTRALRRLRQTLKKAVARAAEVNPAEYLFEGQDWFVDTVTGQKTLKPHAVPRLEEYYRSVLVSVMSGLLADIAAGDLDDEDPAKAVGRIVTGILAESAAEQVGCSPRRVPAARFTPPRLQSVCSLSAAPRPGPHAGAEATV